MYFPHVKPTFEDKRCGSGATLLEHAPKFFTTVEHQHPSFFITMHALITDSNKQNTTVVQIIAQSLILMFALVYSLSSTLSSILSSIFFMRYASAGLDIPRLLAAFDTLP